MVQPDFREPAGFTDPPCEPDCKVCDGIGKVDVSMILDRDGVPRNWPQGSEDVPAPEVDCPWCAS